MTDFLFPFENYISELNNPRFLLLEPPLYEFQFLKILRALEPNFFKVAYSNTRLYNGNANFKFHNLILLKYYQNLNKEKNRVRVHVLP